VASSGFERLVWCRSRGDENLEVRTRGAGERCERDRRGLSAGETIPSRAPPLLAASGNDRAGP